MKFTRMLFLALAFIVPTATTSLASAADGKPAAEEGATPKKAKKGGKKGKKKAGEEEAKPADAEAK